MPLHKLPFALRGVGNKANFAGKEIKDFKSFYNDFMISHAHWSMGVLTMEMT